MSLLSRIGGYAVSVFHSFVAWVAPEIAGGKEFVSELGDEIERLGPQLVYDIVVASLAAATAGGGNTGQIMTRAADSAISTLKSKGKTDLSVAVFGALAAAMLKMHSTAQAQGLAMPPASVMTPAASTPGA